MTVWISLSSASQVSHNEGGNNKTMATTKSELDRFSVLESGDRFNRRPWPDR